MPTPIRLLTVSDVPWISDLIGPTYSGNLADSQIEAWFAGPMTLMLGEPDTPRFLRIVHYELEAASMAAGFPVPAGWASQIADLHPLPLALDPTAIGFLAGRILPLLAEGLAQFQQLYPQVMTRPVWAFLSPALAQLMAQSFPGAQVSGGYIWHTRHQDAAAAVVGARP